MCPPECKRRRKPTRCACPPTRCPRPRCCRCWACRSAAGLTDEEARSRLRRYGPNTIVSRRKTSALARAAASVPEPGGLSAGRRGGAGVLFRRMGRRRRDRGRARDQCADRLPDRAEGGALDRGAARARHPHRPRAPRRPCAAHPGRADGARRHRRCSRPATSISADLRLVEASNLAADESTLTGESVAVDKTRAPCRADARLADRSSMLFKGTALTRGSGVGVVVATGLCDRARPRVAARRGGRSRQLAAGEATCRACPAQLVWATLLLTALIAGVGLATGKDAFLMVEAAIALAVAAIPEGLPIVATLALARGMWRMARQNALIERLSAVETLGATTVILTDKTGTLTENRMTVRRLWIAVRRDRARCRRQGRRPAAARRRPPARAAARHRRALQRRLARQRARAKAAAIRWSWRCCAPGCAPGVKRSALLRSQPVVAQARLRHRRPR